MCSTTKSKARPKAGLSSQAQIFRAWAAYALDTYRKHRHSARDLDYAQFSRGRYLAFRQAARLLENDDIFFVTADPEHMRIWNERFEKRHEERNRFQPPAVIYGHPTLIQRPPYIYPSRPTSTKGVA